MAKTYEVRLRGVVDNEQDVKSTAIGKKEIKANKTNAEVTSTTLGKGVKATIGGIATVYSASQLIAQPIIREMVNTASLSGDYVQADNLQRTNQMIRQSVGLGLEVAGALTATLINPVLGGVALLGSAAKHTVQAINRDQNNRMMETQNSINNFLNSYDSARFVSNKVGR